MEAVSFRPGKLAAEQTWHLGRDAVQTPDGRQIAYDDITSVAFFEYQQRRVNTVELTADAPGGRLHVACSAGGQDHAAALLVCRAIAAGIAQTRPDLPLRPTLGSMILSYTIAAAGVGMVVFGGWMLLDGFRHPPPHGMAAIYVLAGFFILPGAIAVWGGSPWSAHKAGRVADFAAKLGGRAGG